MSKKIFSIVLCIAFVFSFTVSASAASSSNETLLVSEDNISYADKDFLGKMVNVLDGYITNDEGKIEFTYSESDLLALNFSTSDLAALQEINSLVCGVDFSSTGSSPNARVFVEDLIVYFEPGEVVDFLLAAATIGPEALYVAFVGVGTLIGGPVGTAITSIAGILGAASFGSLCYIIIQAVTNGQGVYIGVEMNGIFPNLVAGYWPPMP